MRHIVRAGVVAAMLAGGLVIPTFAASAAVAPSAPLAVPQDWWYEDSYDTEYDCDAAGNRLPGDPVWECEDNPASGQWDLYEWQ